jgi:type II secretory pathway component PulM
MVFFDSVTNFINNLDQESWYKYLAITGAIFLAAVGVILYFYYSGISQEQERIATINESRQEVKTILTKAIRVQKQRAEVNALLEEDPNFKIKQVLQEIMNNIGIVADFVGDTKIDHENNYQEEIVTYQLNGITMKQLAEFLNEIDENKRVFTKELDITKSKRVPHTIDVNITMATMMPKEVA